MNTGLQLLQIATIIFGFIYAIYRFNKETFRASSHENLKALLSIYDDLTENHSLLDIYSIDTEALEKKGISPAQFVYLLKDFTAGQLYYDTHYKHKNGMFPENTYRHHLCGLSSTKDCWPSLRTFFGATNYGNCIDKTIIAIHGKY